MLDRRGFLKASIAATSIGALAACSGRLPLAGKQTDLELVSAVDDHDGRHFICGVDSVGQARFQIPVPERCHGGCAQPHGDHVVVFARRPGRLMHVLNTRTGKIERSINAGDGFHYYGHGVYSPDARYLYVTMNNYQTSAGLVRVYDAFEGYRTVTDFDLDGIGPHELRLHPDGNTLIVALGGIETHPDYDRIKLNLDRMQPALILLDRRTGEITARHQPSHHQLSCRHLDVSPDGVVIAGYQYEGPEWETPPLVVRFDSATGEFRELDWPVEALMPLKNYTASIAISRSSPYAVITAPLGNLALIINYQTGEIVQQVMVADVAGALPFGDNGFVVSSGLGGVYRLSADSDQAVPHGSYAVRWDNHLTPGRYQSV
ncbi:MAG: DUF1513 domain-containing protein [Pseudomonadaceae bacterium]